MLELKIMPELNIMLKLNIITDSSICPKKIRDFREDRICMQS